MKKSEVSVCSSRTVTWGPDVFKRERLDPCNYVSQSVTSVSFSPCWLVVLEEKGLRRVSESHKIIVLIGELQSTSKTNNFSFGKSQGHLYIKQV